MRENFGNLIAKRSIFEASNLFPEKWRVNQRLPNLISKALNTSWGVSAKLSELPECPEWSINGTTAETGKRFRFKRENIGDWSIGYASSSDILLSDAMAVSAAFPGGIGPLALETNKFNWKFWGWGENSHSARHVELPYKNLHLYDGGVYDNLGLEPYFHVGARNIKPSLSKHTAVIVSDAGAPLSKGFSWGAMNPWRLKKVNDIMSEQTRALRVRSFMGYLNEGKSRGTYIYICEGVDQKGVHESAKFASNFPTTLRKLKAFEFDKIFEHGYFCACKASENYEINNAVEPSLEVVDTFE